MDLAFAFPLCAAKTILVNVLVSAAERLAGVLNIWFAQLFKYSAIARRRGIHND
jgi:hypothetical protein